MTRRLRSLLIDSTIGKVFTGTRSTAEATASNKIAGTNLLNKGFASSKKATVAVANNIGGAGGLVLSPGGGLVTSIIMTLATASKGQSVIATVKKGTSYEESTEVGTYQIAEGVKISTNVVTISYSSGQAFFVDITQIGSSSSGKGFAIKFNYYTL